MRFITLNIFLILTALLQVGCWDTAIIEEKGFILSAGIDAIEDDPEMYIFTMTAPVFVELATKRVEVLSTRAHSPLEAFVFFNKVGGRLYFADLFQVLLINEDVAIRGSLLTKFDFVYRDPKVSSLAYLLVSQGTAKEILDTDFQDKNRIAIYLTNLIEEGAVGGLVDPVNLQSFRQAAMDSVHGRDPIVPMVRKLENSIHIDGAALFRGDTMVGKINENEYTHFLILSGKGFPTVFYHRGEATYGLRPQSIRNSITPRIMDGNIVFDIKVNLAVNVDQSFGNTASDLSNQKHKENLEAEVAEFLKGEFLKTTKKLQEFNSDPLGLGKRFRAKYYRVFSEIDWRQYYPHAEINIDVKVKFISHGIIK